MRAKFDGSYQAPPYNPGLTDRLFELIGWLFPFAIARLQGVPLWAPSIVFALVLVEKVRNGARRPGAEAWIWKGAIAIAMLWFMWCVVVLRHPPGGA